MGLWAEIKSAFEYEEPYDKYVRSAYTMLKLVRKEVRGKHKRKNINLDVVRPKEAEKLKFYIKCMSEQGGLNNYKYALARWQIYKALYPEYITDTDRPEFIAECWKDH